MAEQIWVLGESGVLQVFDVPLPAGVQHRLDRGDLTRVHENGTPWGARHEMEPPRGDLPPDAPPLPKRADSRSVWVEFAVSQGVGREQAASMTKNELVDAFISAT